MTGQRTTPTATLTDLLFEKAGVGLCLVAPDGTVLRANSEWLCSSGSTEEQVVGENIIELFPSTRDMALAMHARARAGHHVEVPRYAQTINGSETWLKGSIDPVPMEGGTGLLIMAREIDRCPTRAEHPSSVAEECMLLVAGMKDFAMFTLACDGTVSSWNLGAERLEGYGTKEIVGQHFSCFYTEEDRRAGKPQGQLQLAVEQGRAEDEGWRVRKDGSRFWATVVITALRDDSGELRGFAKITRDMSDRKRAEEVLREGEERLRAAFAASPDAININRLRDGAYVSVNEGFVRLSGWSAAEVLGRTTAELDIWADRVERMRLMQHLLAGEPVQSAEAAFRRKDGTVFTASISARTFTARGERFLLAITRDVSDLKRAENSLHEMNEKLREADRRKDEFIGMLSHELRNPLAPIRNSSYILRHAAPGSEQKRHAEEVIERQAEHLTRLVDDLLDVTRIARGKIELRRATVDLRDVVSRTADDFRTQMEGRGLAFRIALPAIRLLVDADATRLMQLVGNLLHNAAKFTPRGGAVNLSLSEADGSAEVRVSDNGAGIEPALLATLFGVFTQGTRTLARSEGGLGLGLALVKGITELHGGSVRAESAGVGRGAEFVVRLPLAREATPGKAPAREPSLGQVRRVLIVDDNRDAAESLADILRLRGHVVDLAYDGSAAIEKVRADAPDVVLCDIGLPGLSGYEVARTLRESGHLGLRLYAVSGYAQPEDVERALAAGFDGHVAKPCAPEEIERLLG